VIVHNCGEQGKQAKEEKKGSSRGSSSSASSGSGAGSGSLSPSASSSSTGESLSRDELAVALLQVNLPLFPLAVFCARLLLAWLAHPLLHPLSGWSVAGFRVEPAVSALKRRCLLLPCWCVE
jgi:hypothetical protein